MRMEKPPTPAASPLVSRLRFFDANVTIGRQMRTFRDAAYSVEALLSDMDDYGIDEALVCHAYQREIHALDGNEALLRAVEGQPRLHPCFTLLPPESREMPPLPEYLDEMIARGARAVKLFTEPYHLPLSTWVASDVFAHLSARRLPVFIDPNAFLATFEGDRTDWEGIRQVCERWPELPVIVQEARIRRANRTLNVLLALCPNLRVEISGYWGWRCIEFIAREFGAHRLLYGSRLPENDPSATLCRVAYAEVSEEERRRIAGDNLRELLNGVIAP